MHEMKGRSINYPYANLGIKFLQNFLSQFLQII